MKRRPGRAPLPVVMLATLAAALVSGGLPGGPRPALAETARENIALPELVRLGDLFLASGRTGRAIDFYNRFRFNFQREPLFWRRFAALYEHAGDLERALSCLSHVAHLEGTVLGDVVKQSELLWRLQRPEAALARLVGSKEQAEPGDLAYWELLYALAWEEEQELLALEALRMRWQARPDPRIAGDLCHLLAETGGYDEAARVALQGLELSGRRRASSARSTELTLAKERGGAEAQPALLLLGTRLALEGGRLQRAQALIAEATRQEEQYRRYPEYFLARALTAAAAERAREAGRDFARAMTIDRDLDGGCPAWLDAAVTLEDRGMADRALSVCEERERQRPASWDLLADVYHLVGRPAEAARWRSQARTRSAWGEPLDPPAGTSGTEMTLIEAVERDDRQEVASLLARHEGNLSLSGKVAALQTLDRGDEAWRLLEGAGLTGDETLPGSRTEAALVKKARRMRGDRLSGAWATGEARAIGPLQIEGARAWVEQRLSPMYLGFEVEGTRLRGPETLPIWPRAREAAAGAWVRFRGASRETRVMLGARFLPGLRPLPHARLSYQQATIDRRFRLSAQAFVADLPTYTALLRTSAIQDGGSLAAAWLLAQDIEASGLLVANFFSTRNRQVLGGELEVTAEAGRRFDLATMLLRPRVFVTRSLRRNRARLPNSILPVLQTDDDRRQLQLADFASAGLGLALGNDLGSEALGRGPHPALRYGLHGFAAYVWPYLRPGFGVEANLGLVFARHQELATTAFLYSGWREDLGQSYAGLSLTYCLRWY